MDPGGIDRVDRCDPWNGDGNGGFRHLVDEAAEYRVLLGGPTHHGKGPYGIVTVEDRVHLKAGKLMTEGIISQVVPEGPLGFCAQGNGTGDAEIGVEGDHVPRPLSCSETACPQGRLQNRVLEDVREGA